MLLIKMRPKNNCDKAVDCCLAALKFVPDQFVTRKMNEELFTALHVDEIIHNSTNVVFSFNKMGILNIDLNNVNLNNN